MTPPKPDQGAGLVDVHVQAPAELIARLKALASRNERTLSAEVRIALRERIEREAG
ncbi:MAG: hypothetical protein ACYDA6_08855 [Solirubrobacteraceae bacterium]